MSTRARCGTGWPDAAPACSEADSLAACYGLVQAALDGDGGWADLILADCDTGHVAWHLAQHFAQAVAVLADRADIGPRHMLDRIRREMIGSCDGRRN